MLFIMILFSIIMPGLSGKEYVKLNEKLSFLPPRVPILEKFGIMDGTVFIKDKHVDLSKIDEETGLYLPMDYNEKAIVKKTLTNRYVESTTKSPNVIGGQSVIRLDYGSTTATIESKEFYVLSKAKNSYIELDVFEIDSSSNGQIDLLLQTDFGAGYRVVGSVTEVGKHKIPVFESNEDLKMDIVSKLRIRYSSDQGESTASITSVALYDEGSAEPTLFEEGYALSMFKLVDGEGTYHRQNSKMLVASFKYNRYVAAFDLVHEVAFSSSEYDKLMEEWGGDKVEIIPNPDNPDGWFFNEGFPIREVVKKNDAVVVAGEEHSSYEVYLDYAAYLGYSQDKLPYYLFGTSQAVETRFL